MVKCPKCGEVLAEDDVKCPTCRTLIPKDETKDSSSKKLSSNMIIAVIAIVVIIAIVGVLASGMLSGDTQTAVDTTKENDTVDPIVEKDDSSSSESGEYWASAKAEKFHLPTCEWAQKIGDDNKIVYHSRDDAISDGKVPCGACNP